jgi:hypothetical protein
MPRHLVRVVVTFAIAVTALAFSGGAAAATSDLGPNVIVFDPSMPTSQIQTTVNTIASQQISNQFGTERYALLFKPGTYGTSADPLNFQVGYYTSIAGLGRSPGDVVINGSIDVYNQCEAVNSCTALNNFWRSLSNLTINVDTPNFGCYNGEFWAVSQASPMRRVHVNGPTTLMDYCTNPSFASGGFIADSRFDGGTVINGSQQQWLVRNSTLDGWTNGVWNQVFSGVEGAPAECFPAQASCGGPYTTLAKSPVTRDAPYLYVDSTGNESVFVPSAQTNSSGTSWSGRSDTRHIDLDRPVLRRPTVGLGGNDQQSPGDRPQPHPDAGRLPPRREHRGHASRHRRARPRIPDAHSNERERGDDDRKRERDTDLRSHLRRRPAHVAGIAAGRKRPRKERQRGVRTRRLSATSSSASAARSPGVRPRASWSTATTSSSTTSGRGVPITATASAGRSTRLTPASSSTATT